MRSGPGLRPPAPPSAARVRARRHGRSRRRAGHRHSGSHGCQASPSSVGTSCRSVTPQNAVRRPC